MANPAIGLDNRELALVLWLLVAIAFTFIYFKPTRHAFPDIIKTFLDPEIFFALVAMVGYIALLVYLYFLAGLWTVSLLTQTIFWFFGPAIILIFRIGSANEDPSFVRKTLLSTLQFAVLLEFVVNLRSANLIIEIVLVPVLFLIGGLIAVSSARDELRQVKVPMQWILVLVVLAMIIFSVVTVARRPQDFFALATLREFVLPIALTIGFIPFVYGVAIYSTYDGMFSQVALRLDDAGLVRYAKRRLLRSGRLRLKRIQRLAVGFPQMLSSGSNRTEVDQALGKL